MENTQEQKTPEQWFQMLKEPYRTNAIKSIVFNHDKKFDSLIKALMCSTNWIVEGFEEIITSLNKGETTYLEPETLKPEQMESGKWYVIETDNNYVFMVCFKLIDEITIRYDKAWSFYLNTFIDSTYLCHINKTKSIRPATKEEVLKYFPDEVFESEQTDWEAKYKELKSNYELAKNDIEIEKDLREQWHNHYFKLKEEYNELKAKYDQLEPKCEKVYFYFSEQLDQLSISKDLEAAIKLSCNDMEIYEAVCIGKKKSVLVNETT